MIDGDNNWWQRKSVRHRTCVEAQGKGPGRDQGVLFEGRKFPKGLGHAEGGTSWPVRMVGMVRPRGSPSSWPFKGFLEGDDLLNSISDKKRDAHDGVPFFFV